MRVPSQHVLAWPALLLAMLLVALGAFGALGACSDAAGLGASCDSSSGCESGLQCVRDVCIERCERASQCGDGFTCNSEGQCDEATGVEGSACDSETDCSAGLACLLDDGDEDQDGSLQATCVADKSGHAIGNTCTADSQCRNGTCALGRCVDLCAVDRDCPLSMKCVTIPRVEANGAVFRGCLPERAVLTWDIPVPAPSADVLVPVPSHARSLSLAMSVGDDSQLVGASYVTSPRGQLLFDRRRAGDDNSLRHRALPNLSVLQIPSTSAVSRIEPGAYHVSLSSLRPNGNTGSATPRLKASLRTGEETDSPTLQLHFHFLDLTDHPCAADRFGGKVLSAETARTMPGFQAFDNELRNIFAGPLALGSYTFDDIEDAPQLDNVTSENVVELLKQGKYSDGINVFLVRGISPVGVVAMGPSPGTAGVKGTRASGVVISLEPLCYSTWPQLARTTAHQIARYMGLYPNRDVAGVRDPISDTGGEADNLLFFSEQGGIKLTPHQRTVLISSPSVEGKPVQ
jgi:hypothetical protein